MKGCGNLAEGFPIEPFELKENGFEVRGCCYQQTSFRELHMQSRINKILDEANLTGGNQPLGVFQYADLSYGVQPYCAIFKTLGDMRLQTNLFQGILKNLQQKCGGIENGA